MNKLDAIKNKFLEVDKAILEGIQKAFVDNDSIVEDLNIEQLDNGKRSDGVILPDYSPVSVEVYGKPEGPIKLKDTGAFRRGISVKIDDSRAELVGKDSKTQMLKDDYGDEIIGLSEESTSEFQNDYIRPSIHESLTDLFND